MWVYSSGWGELFRIFNVVPIKLNLVSKGYSGNGAGMNNPKMENVPNVGPIPTGFYTIGMPFDSPEHGPECLPLTPDVKNTMYGRSGFLIHGDSTTNPGCSSRGCIILPKIVRDLIAQTLDKDLQVIH
jgi:hypothetical protein